MSTKVLTLMSCVIWVFYSDLALAWSCAPSSVFLHDHPIIAPQKENVEDKRNLAPWTELPVRGNSTFYMQLQSTLCVRFKWKRFRQWTTKPLHNTSLSLVRGICLGSCPQSCTADLNYSASAVDTPQTGKQTFHCKEESPESPVISLQ